MSVIDAPGSLTRGRVSVRAGEVYVSGLGAANRRQSSSTVGPVLPAEEQSLPRRATVTRSELVGHTLVCAIEASRAATVDEMSVQTLVNVVAALVEDDFPTPQVSASGDGAIMAKWIVNGRSLTVDCTQHIVDIWAHDDGGNEFLADELDGRYFATRPVASEARQYLKELSRDVLNRVAVRKFQPGL